MSRIKPRFQIEHKKIVIIGAGKIGRSFIGQLFGTSGYEITFIDIDPFIVQQLNVRRSYKVIIRAENEKEILIRNVKAILASNRKEVINSIATAGIMAVSVGKPALEKIIPVIAAGLEFRYNHNPENPLDIIIAENMIGAGIFMKRLLKEKLPANYPFDMLVGLIETSIGKMVPIMTAAEQKKDPLMVYAEPYNTLILDGKGFKTRIPDIEGLAPKENIKAWVDRKAFIHNLGHATAAYYGYHLHPEAVYLYEVLDDKKVNFFVGEVMLQSANILISLYPNDFSIGELEEHIDDLISRFSNRYLRDTIYRVGYDLRRKLSSDDRFMGAIHLALQSGKPYDRILKAMSFGFCFDAPGEDGIVFPSDKTFLEELSKDFKSALILGLKFDPVSDKRIIDELKSLYKVLKH